MRSEFLGFHLAYRTLPVDDILHDQRCEDQPGMSMCFTVMSIGTTSMALETTVTENVSKTG